VKYGERVPAEPFSRFLQERYEMHLKRVAYGAVTDRRNKTDKHAPTGPDDRGVCATLVYELGWVPDGAEKNSIDAAIRKLYRYRHQLRDTKPAKRPDGTFISSTEQAETWRRAVVEEAFHYIGVAFEDYYPDHVIDPPLLPEKHCETCAEIDGLDYDDAISPHDLGGCVWCQGRAEFDWYRRKRDKERASERRREERRAAA